MSDDIQKETEHIHQGVVDSLSFSEALAARDAEIKALRLEVLFRDTEVRAKADEIERLRGLLHEAEKMWPNPGLSTESSQWYRCVREELGKTDEIADYDGVDVEKVRTIPALAAILRKAQGVVDVEGGSPVDVGAECVAIREEHDALRQEIALLYKRREIDEAEIERLRGLLRYAVPSGDAPKDWYKRVREALGE